MSLIYYLVSHDKKMAVVIGDDANKDPYIWPDQLHVMNDFLKATKGYPVFCLHEEDIDMDRCLNEYEILGDE